ncbi:hypothetical protein U0C82_13080 [Fulvimarina sp. 2208YS6-2-32]|uniref:Oxygen tolerance n=1 Tax=Fulvimarina uroteuthidis TaxID=3098149 RepID=A0ABU5I3V8_9HYPH|nr:hypothetical protein [Fulvimarina sp. 2208YS6-2-32]MDY8110074.1 hypothetical protein [Fulvimarina sp. 2208YS6-2-32]
MVVRAIVRWAAALAVFVLSAAAALVPATAAPSVPEGDTRLVVEIEAGSQTPYVGEMILVTITGYYDVTIALEKFETIDLPNFTWVQLDRDIWSRDRVGGREFKTVERKLALYPQKTGLQTIGPFRHDLTLMEGKAERFKHTVVSNAVEVEVLQKPETNGGWWFPARDVILSDTWDMDPAHMANGATATRTVKITAYGQPDEMLPNPPYMFATSLVSFIAPEKRSTEITRDGPIGTVEWTWRIRPSDAEPGEIRAFRIPWFDTRSRQMREIVIASQRVAFAAIAEPEEREDNAAKLSGLALPLLLGLIVPVVAVLPGRRLLPASHIAARIGRRFPDRNELALRWALWRGDAPAYRMHAARLIGRSGRGDEGLLADLDRSLFGHAAGRTPPDLRRVHRGLVRSGALRR